MKKKKLIRRGEDIGARDRSLDLLVANEVFGWDVGTDGVTYPADIVLDKQPPQFVWYTQRSRPEEGRKKLPNFSTNEGDAFALFNYLRESGMFCCLKIDCDYNYRWAVKLTLAPTLDEGTKDGKHKPGIIVEYDEFPLAVALAAVEGVRAYKKAEAKMKKFRDTLKCGAV